MEEKRDRASLRILGEAMQAAIQAFDTTLRKSLDGSEFTLADLIGGSGSVQYILDHNGLNILSTVSVELGSLLSQEKVRELLRGVDDSEILFETQYDQSKVSGSN